MDVGSTWLIEVFPKVTNCVQRRLQDNQVIQTTSNCELRGKNQDRKEFAIARRYDHATALGLKAVRSTSSIISFLSRLACISATARVEYAFSHIVASHIGRMMHVRQLHGILRP